MLTVHFLGWTDAWNEEVLRGSTAGQLAPFATLSSPWELALRPGDLVELNRAHPSVVAALTAASASTAQSSLAPVASPAAHHGAAAASRGLWVVGCVVAMDHGFLPPLMTVAFAVPAAAAADAPLGGSSSQQLGAVPALATLPVISAEKDACVRLGTHITRDKALYMFKQEIFERAGIVLPPAPHSPAFVETEAGTASARAAALPLPPAPQGAQLA